MTDSDLPGTESGVAQTAEELAAGAATTANDGNGEGETAHGFYILLFGVYHVLLAIVLGFALITLIKEVEPDQVPGELELLLVVIVAGALGSYVHAATSFASYVGNRNLGSSWLWWYVLRPFIGSGLAVLFYFVVRGGFLSAGSQGAKALNLYGLAALAGLTGMFSKQATDKLREVFDNLFKVAKDDRKNKLAANDGDGKPDADDDAGSS